jgi:hypothetical protein
LSVAKKIKKTQATKPEFVFHESTAKLLTARDVEQAERWETQINAMRAQGLQLHSILTVWFKNDEESWQERYPLSRAEINVGCVDIICRIVAYKPNNTEVYRIEWERV